MYFFTLGSSELGASVIAEPSQAPATPEMPNLRPLTTIAPFNQVIIRPASYVPPISLVGTGGGSSVSGAFTIQSFTAVGDSALVFTKAP